MKIIHILLIKGHVQPKRKYMQIKTNELKTYLRKKIDLNNKDYLNNFLKQIILEI